MKHKHCELIKAWADGAEIEQACRNGVGEILWYPFKGTWSEYYEYRIKPEPKPDVVKNCHAKILSGKFRLGEMLNEAQHLNNLKLTFDGETGELKSAEVLK